MSAKQQTGTVISWNRERGFGFIQAANGKNHFAHIREWMSDDEPTVGHIVIFESVSADKVRKPSTSICNLTSSPAQTRLRLVSKMLDDIRFEQSVRDALNSNQEPDISFRLDSRYKTVRARIEQEQHSLEPTTLAVMEPAPTAFESRALPLIERGVPVFH